MVNGIGEEKSAEILKRRKPKLGGSGSKKRKPHRFEKTFWTVAEGFRESLAATGNGRKYYGIKKRQA